MFKDFAKIVNEKAKELLRNNTLFEADCPDLYEQYLDAFPPGTNEIFRERQEHDCNTCKHFIRNVGKIVSIYGPQGLRQSVWDVDISDELYPYNVVAKKLAKIVKSSPIIKTFKRNYRSYGCVKNRQLLDDGSVMTWYHFYANIPSKHIGIGDRQEYELLKNTVEKITPNEVNVVLELIQQGNLYRGKQYQNMLEGYLELLDKLDKSVNKDNMIWKLAYESPESIVHIKNSSIGVLLTDLREGESLETAVTKYESRVAPANYKRPKPIITKRMLEDARKMLEENGLLDSVFRRPATINDVDVSNVLFISRKHSPIKDIKEDLFTELEKETSSKYNFTRLKQMHIDQFIKDVLPTIDSLEVLFEHTSNLVALTTEKNPGSKLLFKWDNPFAWSYIGNVTDSIKEKVKKAGGDTEGILRASLSWDYIDDLDIHCLEPNGFEIYHANKKSNCTDGKLDVDKNWREPFTTEPVENIIWKRKLIPGMYKIYVHNYRKRDFDKKGFEVEFEYKGKIWLFKYDKPLSNKETVNVVTFRIDKQGNLTFIENLPMGSLDKEVWNIKTNNFYEVSSVMYSPNYWNKQTGIGHKHYFFMIPQCKFNEPIRGFYNEYLKPELEKFRKVMELMGEKTKISPSDTENALCGLGFSIDSGEEVIIKTTGNNVTSLLKIIF